MRRDSMIGWNDLTDYGQTVLCVIGLIIVVMIGWWL